MEKLKGSLQNPVSDKPTTQELARPNFPEPDLSGNNVICGRVSRESQCKLKRPTREQHYSLLKRVRGFASAP
jgi:hypothetical protein